HHPTDSRSVRLLHCPQHDREWPDEIDVRNDVVRGLEVDRVQLLARNELLDVDRPRRLRRDPGKVFLGDLHPTTGRDLVTARHVRLGDFARDWWSSGSRAWFDAGPLAASRSTAAWIRLARPPPDTPLVMLRWRVHHPLVPD